MISFNIVWGIEDDEISRMLLTTSMKNYSKEILIARTGTQPVEIAPKNPDIDLIMMVIQMPDKNGYEATRQIRLINRDVVIIAQSAFGPGDDSEKAIEVGCNEYIAKPINMAVLNGLIMKYFSVAQK